MEKTKKEVEEDQRNEKKIETGKLIQNEKMYFEKIQKENKFQ